VGDDKQVGWICGLQGSQTNAIVYRLVQDEGVENHLDETLCCPHINENNRKPRKRLV
jgi:histidinol phosphatase-like enzyme